MRILHTSDWHLGHSLHELGRQHEHDHFLSWLVDLLGAEQIDSLLVTGDLFDSANPSALSQARWFSFLAELRLQYPNLDIVVIGGNHDSAARLDAPRPILESMNIHIIGGLPRDGEGDIAMDKLLVPLRDATGSIAAWVAAVPFLRPGDLPRADTAAASTEGRLISGVRGLYSEVLAALRETAQPGQALIATGHCYMAGAKLSELSERKIQGGNQNALPIDIFTDDLTYVALGHLHLPQSVSRSNIRYAGAPLPLSMAEANYEHQVYVLEVDGQEIVSEKAHIIPKILELVRIPAGDPAPLDAVLPHLLALPGRAPDCDEKTLPFLEVRIALESAIPGLRRRIQEALVDKAVRLVKITATFTGTGDALADTVPMEQLRDIQPEEVFIRRYRRDHEADPSPPLLASFHELLDAVRQGSSQEEA
ncbi:MAG: exonuclease SbcCD subunit D C-terminal domain-containing protein [Myxococcota bacterium]|nr:exonuclease SbcCD subunit D C-terminal domain-containing protein [Myxococcota bacterium]